jgi:hypothetical protein
VKWFRWYRGATENPKFAIIAARANKCDEEGIGGGSGNRLDGAVNLTDVIAVWAVILEDAANLNHWGRCLKDAKFIAVVLRWHEEEVQHIINEFVTEGMMDENGNVTKWHEYQYTSDVDPTRNERQKRYYDRHKRKGNGATTVAKRKPNALVLRPDTDTDTDTDITPKSPKGDAAFKEEFETTFWPAYPRKAAKAPALKAFLKKRKTVSLEDLISGLARIDTERPEYIPHAATWLNQERWQDEAINKANSLVRRNGAGFYIKAGSAEFTAHMRDAERFKDNDKFWGMKAAERKGEEYHVAERFPRQR